MSWNLRIVYNPRTQTIGFKEVYYTKNGTPKYWSVDFQDPKSYLLGKYKNPKILRDAFKKPVLKENKKSLTKLS